MSSSDNDRTPRRLVAAVVALTLLACLVSYALGTAPGKMFGYELFTRKSGGLIWLVIAVMVAVTAWPLWTFVSRGEVEIWDRSVGGLRLLDRDESPFAYWSAIWAGLFFFVFILGGLFIFRLAER